MATWNEVSARLGRNDMPAALIYAVFEERLTDSVEIAKGVQAAWTMCEWPSRAADRELWMHVFDKAVPEGHYLLETAPRPIADLAPNQTLWRGATEEHALGMSWTDDYDRAYWFATRLEGAFGGAKSLVYSLNAPREIVLARFNESRGESEWVLDVDDLTMADLEIV